MNDARPSLLFAPACHVCDRRVVTLEVVPPGGLPHKWDDWDHQSQQIFRERYWPDKYTVIYEGIVAGSGPSGTPKSEQEARRIVQAIVPVLRIDAIHEPFYDDLGYCAECSAFYCKKHWSPDRGGYGHCPQGHGKSLDPHWSPEGYN